MKDKQDKTFTKVLGGAGFGFGSAVGLMSPFMLYPGPYRPPHSNRGVMILSLGGSIVGTTFGATTGFTIDKTLGFFKPSAHCERKAIHNEELSNMDGNNPFQ